MNGSSLDCYFGYSRYIPSVDSHVVSPSNSSAVPQILFNTNWHIAIQHVLFCLWEGSSIFNIYLVPSLVTVLVPVLAPPLESIQVQVSFISADIC